MKSLFWPPLSSSFGLVLASCTTVAFVFSLIENGGNMALRLWHYVQNEQNAIFSCLCFVEMKSGMLNGIEMLKSGEWFIFSAASACL